MYSKQAFRKPWNHHRSHRYRGCGSNPRKEAWKAYFRDQFSQPPANVVEMDDKYELQIFAPGFEKSDFVIAITDQNLSVSVEQQEEPQANFRRKEYLPSGFKRQFALNEIIDKEAIEASYESGVLVVTLPKLDGFETDRQEIKVA